MSESRLANLTEEVLQEPIRMIVFGPEGVGKTTFAAGAPKPIWFDVNAGSGKLKVARYPFTNVPKREHVPQTYEQIKAAVRDLTVTKHSFQTLVIDTLGDLEKLLHQYILERDKPKSKDKLPGINAYGYSKGPGIALDEWRVFWLMVEEMQRETGMNVVCLDHQVTRKYKSPITDDYDRISLAVDEQAAGFLRGRCDVVAFAAFEDTVSDQFQDERVRGVDTGRRLLKFRRRAAYDAKSRYALPDELELAPSNSWGVFASALSEAQSMTADQLVKAIEAECARVGDDIATEKARNYIKDANGDTTTLKVVLEKMREKMPVSGNVTNETKGVQ